MKDRLKKHYIPLALLILAAGYIFYLNRGRRDTIAFISHSTGLISLVLLSISLIIGPLNLLLKRKNPLSTYMRRDISITGGVLAIIHSVFGLFVHLRGKPWLYFVKKTGEGYSLRFDNFGIANDTGLISALIIIVLLITSNDYYFKKLKQGRWKNIQRFSYIMFLLTLVHCYFYNIGKSNKDSLYFFYIPLVAILLVSQFTGMWLHSSRRT